MRTPTMARAILILLTIPALAPAPAATVAAGGGGEGDGEAWNVGDPPGEWRSVAIDTTETTWSNVDVSPDGRTLLFDMLGDLYTVPIEGGEATALTEGFEWDYQPRYSPDGSKIAFVSDRGGGDNLWVMNADGSEPAALTEEKEHLVHNPSWSPDGDYLVAKKSFTSTRSIPAGEIWLFHAGGGGGLQLTERPHGERDQKNMAEPAFSPDGRYVYYSRDVTQGYGAGRFCRRLIDGRSGGSLAFHLTGPLARLPVVGPNLPAPSWQRVSRGPSSGKRHWLSTRRRRERRATLTRATSTRPRVGQ